jgi:hypothetical protein
MVFAGNNARIFSTLGIVALLLATGLTLIAQNRPQLAPETAGMDAMVDALITVFDHSDVLGLTDTHQRKFDSDLRIQLVRHPGFASKARFIVVEFANTAAELQRVWRNTCCPRTWDSPVYADFFNAVRTVNRTLPASRRVRVLAGDPPAGTPSTDRGPTAANVLKTQVLDKGEKALVIYGCGHLSRWNGDLTKPVEATHPNRMFVVGQGSLPAPASQQFERALKSPGSPVLVPATNPPFNTLNSECGPIGLYYDAFVYLGSDSTAQTFVRPAPAEK